MIEFWKLPKAIRRMSEKRVNDLTKTIQEKEARLSQLKNLVSEVEFVLNNARKKLKEIKKRYGIKES